MHKARNILFIAIIALLVWSCKEQVKDIVQVEGDKQDIPTIVSTDVVTLISDSGITQYRITTPLWKIFEEAKKPYWKFPIGLFLEKFDSIFDTEASIKCDSATYYKEDQLWQLDGHVTILNVEDEVILTQQLFWDQRKQKVYSDSFIHIEKKDRIIEGYGFVSNEKMTVYELDRVSGIFPVEEKQQQKDTTDRSVINK